MKHLHITLSNNTSDFNTLATKLESFFQDNNTIGLLLPITLILEELYTNTVTHGASDGREVFVEINLELNEDELAIIYKDNGVQFNVLELPEPDLKAPIETREIGGLGVHYVKFFTDSIEYEYVEKNNVLKMKKKLNN
jgi:anti-sigma regulatory factor (Ser/Thr protein kinase)